MATLYDAHGTPIDRGRLREELAGPTTTGVRTPLSGHPAQGLTPQRLIGLMNSAEQGNATAYLELAEEMEEKDLHYRSVLGTRKLQVSGLEMTVEAASDAAEDVRAADLVRDFLFGEVLQEALFDILDAVGKGYSVSEILWDTEGPRWYPREIVWRDPRWFGYDPLEGRTLRMMSESGLLEPLAPAKFIVHTSKSKSGLPIRGGLARAAAWGYLFKNFDLKAWLIFCEVYGHPLRLGKYDSSSSPEEREVLLRAVRNVGADHAAIVPQSMLIDFIDAKAQGNAEIFEKLAEYLDRQISKAVLGQTGTTDTGSRVGTAEAHERVRTDIEQSDAVQLAATLNRDMVCPLVMLNLGPRRQYPRLRIHRPDQEDVSALVDNVVKLLPYGLKVESSVMADKLGLPEPDAQSDLLGMASPPVATDAPESDADAAVDEKPKEKTAQRAQVAEEMDAIDALADAAAEGWEPVLTPLVEPVLELLEQSTSTEDFLDRLPTLVDGQDSRALTESLARALFAARLQGMLDMQGGGRG